MNALAPVFLAAGGVTAVGFALSWLLQEKPLRETAATSTGLDDSLAAPRSPDSLAEIERALARATGLELRRRFATRIAERADMGLSGAATWALVRIDEHGVLTARAMAEEDGVEAERIAATVDELRRNGLIAGEGGTADLTPDGRTLAVRAVAARRELLLEVLADESASRDPAVDRLLRRLARELAGEPPPHGV